MHIINEYGMNWFFLYTHMPPANYPQTKNGGNEQHILEPFLQDGMTPLRKVSILPHVLFGAIQNSKDTNSIQVRRSLPAGKH